MESVATIPTLVLVCLLQLQRTSTTCLTLSNKRAGLVLTEYMRIPCLMKVEGVVQCTDDERCEWIEKQGDECVLYYFYGDLAGLTIHSEATYFDDGNLAGPAQNALTLTLPEEGLNGRWLLAVGATNQGFVIDMGSVHNVNVISLWNTHNAHWNDRGTERFTLSLSSDALIDAMTDWTEYYAGTLPDARDADIQMQTYGIGGCGRYVQFIAKSYYGSSAGLQYIRISGVSDCSASD